MRARARACCYKRCMWRWSCPGSSRNRSSATSTPAAAAERRRAVASVPLCLFGQVMSTDPLRPSEQKQLSLPTEKLWAHSTKPGRNQQTCPNVTANGEACQASFSQVQASHRLETCCLKDVSSPVSCSGTVCCVWFGLPVELVVDWISVIVIASIIHYIRAEWFSIQTDLLNCRFIENWWAALLISVWVVCQTKKAKYLPCSPFF